MEAAKATGWSRKILGQKVDAAHDRVLANAITANNWKKTVLGPKHTRELHAAVEGLEKKAHETGWSQTLLDSKVSALREKIETEASHEHDSMANRGFHERITQAAIKRNQDQIRLDLEAQAKEAGWDTEELSKRLERASEAMQDEIQAVQNSNRWQKHLFQSHKSLAENRLEAAAAKSGWSKHKLEVIHSVQ